MLPNCPNDTRLQHLNPNQAKDEPGDGYLCALTVPSPVAEVADSFFEFSPVSIELPLLGQTDPSLIVAR